MTCDKQTGAGETLGGCLARFCTCLKNVGSMPLTSSTTPELQGMTPEQPGPPSETPFVHTRVMASGQ